MFRVFNIIDLDGNVINKPKFGLSVLGTIYNINPLFYSDFMFSFSFHSRYLMQPNTYLILLSFFPKTRLTPFHSPQTHLAIPSIFATTIGISTTHLPPPPNSSKKREDWAIMVGVSVNSGWGWVRHSRWRCRLESRSRGRLGVGFTGTHVVSKFEFFLKS